MWIKKTHFKLSTENRSFYQQYTQPFNQKVKKKMIIINKFMLSTFSRRWKNYIVSTNHFIKFLVKFQTYPQKTSNYIFAADKCFLCISGWRGVPSDIL